MPSHLELRKTGAVLPYWHGLASKQCSVGSRTEMCKMLNLMFWNMKIPLLYFI